MSDYLVDSNVLLDVFTEDETWCSWSAATLAGAAASGTVGINPLIYAEVSLQFDDIRSLDAALAQLSVHYRSLPWEAGFGAGRAYQRYRTAHQGTKRSPLPDFYIGAHAEHEGLTLVTRDPRRYRTYFPSVTLITPPTRDGAP